MFEEIFFPRTAERYPATPLVDQRERYLLHLRETGARRATSRHERRCSRATTPLHLIKRARSAMLMLTVYRWPRSRGKNTPARPKKFRFWQPSLRRAVDLILPFSPRGVHPPWLSLPSRAPSSGAGVRFARPRPQAHTPQRSRPRASPAPITPARRRLHRN